MTYKYNATNSYFPELTDEQAVFYQWITNLFTENIEEQFPATSRFHTLGRAH